MRYDLLFIVCLFASFCRSQNNDVQENESFFITPEVVIGKTVEANEGFPKTSLLKGLIINFGNYSYSNDTEWAIQLNYPKTGVSLGIIDLGNKDKLGLAFSFIPFAEINIYKRWNLHFGMGASYMDTLYDEIDNPFNRAITTHLNWAFRAFVYYDIFQGEKNEWRLGLGYFHNSNGHTRLPNQGLNSFLASFSTKIDLKPDLPKIIENPIKERTIQSYFSTRLGLGQNVLSEIYNDKKPVYSIAFSIGKIINKTFKFGVGFYYRYYQHYFDYIKDEGELVLQQYPVFMENPFGYASNYGLFGSAELLLGHIGFEFSLGFNIHKPFYAIDWKLNEGFSYENMQGETVNILGDLNWYYEIKRSISSRLGLKYYLINTNKVPKHNLYLGMHINGNLGQADFTDLSLGYVYRSKLKERRIKN